MSHEKRKHPRYDTDLEAIFYDQKRTRAKVVNASKKGCQIIIKKGANRPIGSMITFRVFFDGPAQLNENTMPSINVKDLLDQKGDYKPGDYPNAVKILGKVMRHLDYQGSPSMGIELHELDGADMIKWSNFINKLSVEQIVLPYTGQEAALPKQSSKIPTYALQFKTLDHAIRYFPRDPNKSFFIPSNILKNKGDIIHIRMVHPEDKTILKFDAVVQSYGPNPKNESVKGIFAQYQNLGPELKEEINTFTRFKLFET